MRTYFLVSGFFIGGLLLLGGVFFIFSNNEKTLEKETPHGKEDVVEVDKKEIVASFYPLAYFAKEIGGDRVEVINLSGAQDVHEYTPTPGDIVRIMGADLVLYQGANLEPWAEDMEDRFVRENISHTAVLERLQEEGLVQKDEHEDEHEDEHGDEYEDAHDHGGLDPHTWIDPILAQEMVYIIQTSLKDIDQEGKSEYETRATDLLNRLSVLDQEYIQRLSVCERDEVIVSHDAFEYIAHRYGFTTHTIAGISPLDEPSAQALALLKQETKDGAEYILTESNSVTRYAETLSRETGLQMLSINPMGRGTLDPTKDYFDVARDNLDAIALALGCE